MAERLHPYMRFQQGQPVSIAEIRERSHGLIPTVRRLIEAGEVQIIGKRIEGDFNYTIQLKGQRG